MSTANHEPADHWNIRDVRSPGVPHRRDGPPGARLPVGCPAGSYCRYVEAGQGRVRP